SASIANSLPAPVAPTSRGSFHPTDDAPRSRNTLGLEPGDVPAVGRRPRVVAVAAHPARYAVAPPHPRLGCGRWGRLARADPGRTRHGSVAPEAGAVDRAAGLRARRQEAQRLFEAALPTAAIARPARHPLSQFRVVAGVAGVAPSRVGEARGVPGAAGGRGGA